MLVLIQATIPTTSNLPMSTSSDDKDSSQSWTDVKLNLIMLPVGIGLLLALSLTACICYYSRKKQIERQAKERRRRLRKSIKNRTGANGNHAKEDMFYVNSARSIGTSSPNGGDLQSPGVIKKEKRKKKKKLKKFEDLVKNEDGLIKNENNNENLEMTKGKTKEFRKQQGSTKKSHNHFAKEHHSSRLKHEKRENAKPYRNQGQHSDVTQDNIAFSNDRNKWDMHPEKHNKQDPSDSMRLPPFESLMLAKSA
eukprot:gene11824-13048_t